MKKKKSILQEINAGSMSDIAFLLLIFFLITTTMASDQGILNLLPSKDVEGFTVKKERNVLKILINKDDELWVEDKPMDIKELADFAVKFITNKGVDENLSESPQKAIVSLKNDRGTSYDAYIEVQDELRKAYRRVYNTESKSRYKMKFMDLSDAQQNVIKDLIPQIISEAEPESIGDDL